MCDEEVYARLVQCTSAWTLDLPLYLADLSSWFIWLVYLAGLPGRFAYPGHSAVSTLSGRFARTRHWTLELHISSLSLPLCPSVCLSLQM